MDTGRRKEWQGRGQGEIEELSYHELQIMLSNTTLYLEIISVTFVAYFSTYRNFSIAFHWSFAK